MMADLFHLNEILLGFESTLHLEYSDPDTDRCIRRAKEHLENAYQCKLDEPVYTVQAKNELVSENLDLFVRSLASDVQKLTALTSYAMFTKKPPVTLDSVNFLGFTRETLCMTLKYLQDRILYEKRAVNIPAIKSALNNVEVSQVKRLFIIMLTLETLGIYEGVAACAQLLYLGGISL